MIFITGGTGYIGSYITHRLLHTTQERLGLLTRAKTDAQAKDKAWKALQLHMDQETFERFLPRMVFFKGDVTLDHLGLQQDDLAIVQEETTSMLHVAASLNRKSETKCAQINLMGTLRMVELAKACPKVKRFGFVSTVAVAGERHQETVLEDQAVDWSRRDYDPYARTKKYCEELVTRMLPEIETVIYCPSIVLGDHRMEKTTQFDMALSFVHLSKMPILPFSKDARLDIVPANFVGYGIADIHVKEKLTHHRYHMSAGEDAVTFGQIAKVLEERGITKMPIFLPKLYPLVRWCVDRLQSLPKSWGISQMASLLKVFLPYLEFDTVFDNAHTVETLDTKPEPFTTYCAPFFDFVTTYDFTYPYKPLT